ncbi:MAG: NIPSNAP family protein [Candidatus Rokuibacteriota bacterium]
MDLGSPIVELRQYTLHPGTRETLVRVFEEHFIEGQERCGMRIVGQFRDLDDPDRFVWIRGFSDMDTRTRALEAFYGGPVWKEHGPLANTTMIDHTNVLLLRPADPRAGFRFDPRLRPPPEAAETPGGVVVATIHHLAVPASPDVVASLRDHMEAATLLAQFVTESARNPFTRLPVREDANVFVTVAAYPSADANRPSTVSSPAVSRVEHLRLQPTRRSFLRHRPIPPLGGTHDRPDDRP